MALAAGTRIGPYEVLELLGAGGMGEVYRARDSRLGRDVAVKILPERFAHSADRLRRFECEARAAGALSHPNVLTVFDVGSHGAIPYLVCELLEGETLQDVLRTQRLNVRQGLTLALQVAHGVACVHESGVLHRDLKPENLFLTRDGRVKILDFGVAKLLQPGEGAPVDGSTATGDTNAGSIVGTAAYMSPEQIRDERLDGRCDLFAIGAILYEMLAQRPPFTGESGSDVIASILRDDAPALASLGVPVPSAVETLIRRCLEKRREDRFASAGEMVVALETLLDSLRSADAVPERRDAFVHPLHVHPRTSSAPTLIALGRQRVRGAVMIAGGTAVTLIALALLARWRAAPPPPAPHSLAVMYFENLSDRTDGDNLGRMFTGLLTTDLAGSPGLQVVSTQRLHDITRQAGKPEGTPDRTVATEVARRAQAARMVLGQVAQAGPRIVATIELVDVASGQLLGSYRAEGSSTQDVFAMAERLGADLRAKITGQRPQPAAASLTRQLTSSAEAYRAYVRGEAFFQRWELEKAASEFREATRIDPAFAFAHYRLSLVATMWGWAGLPQPEIRTAAERAAALKERLLSVDRDLVEGNRLFVTGRPSEAIPILETVLERDPDHKEALYLLGRCYEFSARDSDPRRAVELMEKLLAIDPDFHAVYSHLPLNYAFLGQFEKAYARLEEWEAKEPETVRVMRAAVSSYEGDLDEALRLSEAAEGFRGIFWRGRQALAAGRWDIVQSVLREHGDDSGVLGFSLKRVRAMLHVFRGEFERAQAAYVETVGAPWGPDDSGRGAFAAVGLHQLGDLLAMKGDLSAARRQANQALEIQPNGPYCLYFAGRLAVSSGDFTAAERHFRTLEEVTKTARSALAPHYRDVLRAEIIRAEGRPSEALPVLERALTSGHLREEAWSFSPGPRFREALARAYLDVGDKHKAALVLNGILTGGMDRVGHPVPYIRAHYTLGKLKLELGDVARGRQLLLKFLEYWGKADWDLPEVRDARARLAATSS